MKPLPHMALGAAAALLPDAVLWTFGWRRRWLPENHTLVRAHRFLHSPAGVVALAAASHVIADRYSTHRIEPVLSKGSS